MGSTIRVLPVQVEIQLRRSVKPLLFRPEHTAIDWTAVARLVTGPSDLRPSCSRVVDRARVADGRRVELVYLAPVGWSLSEGLTDSFHWH
jgi:hypothetical protein